MNQEREFVWFVFLEVYKYGILKYEFQLLVFEFFICTYYFEMKNYVIYAYDFLNMCGY